MLPKNRKPTIFEFERPGLNWVGALGLGTLLVFELVLLYSMCSH